MNYAIVGGDMRSVRLAEALAADGHTVHCFANEKSEIQGAVRCTSLFSCLYGADIIILPIPAEKDGFLNTPLSREKIRAEELFTCLAPGQKIIGGGIGSRLLPFAKAGGNPVFDLLKDDGFTAFNALLTAEGAAGLLIHDCDRAVLKSKALVLGYGRVGRALAGRLKALGSDVTAAVRSDAALAEAKNAGLHTIRLSELENKLGSFHFVINTIPARVLSNAALCTAGESTVFMELASAPGGYDGIFAENIGLKTISAPGLPGRFSPRTAAQAIKQAVYSAAEAGKE